MPKRRMTSRRRAQIRAWQLAGVRAHGKPHLPEWGSYSDPHLGREKLGWSHRKQRTIKYMGKNAYKHSGGVSESKPNGSVTIAPWVADVLAGKHATTTENPKLFHPTAIRGDITQSRGVTYRKRAPKTKLNGKKVAK